MDTSTFDLPRYLAELPLFSDLSHADRERLAAGCQWRRVARGAMVFRVGEPCDAFHVTVKGQIRLFALAPTGQEKVIEIAGPGRSFAEAVMFTGSPYIVSAQALTDSLVLSVHKSVVIAEIQRDASFALNMLAGISRRQHGLIRDVEAYALHSGVQRVIGYLLREHAAQSDDGGGSGTVSLPVSKATIASRLSLTPEYFSRVLHELEADGLVTIDRRDIHIRDIKRLASSIQMLNHERRPETAVPMSAGRS